MALTEQEQEFIVPEWTFGERLAKARRVAGLTQKAMAAVMEVSESTLAAWETGRNQPTDLFVTVRRWAEATGVSYGWLLGGDQNWKEKNSTLIALPTNPNPEPSQRTLPVGGHLRLVPTST